MLGFWGLGLVSFGSKESGVPNEDHGKGLFLFVKRGKINLPSERCRGRYEKIPGTRR